MLLPCLSYFVPAASCCCYCCGGVMRKEMDEHGHQRTDEHSWLLLSWLAAFAFLPVHSAAAAANLAAPFPLSLLHPSL